MYICVASNCIATCRAKLLSAEKAFGYRDLPNSLCKKLKIKLSLN